MSFRVGQKVVCVDAEWSGKYLPAGYTAPEHVDMSGLHAGRIYTIRDVAMVLDVKCCRLEEIIRGFEPLYQEEAYFSQMRFRPVVKRETDISVFTRTLISKSVREYERTGHSHKFCVRRRRSPARASLVQLLFSAFRDLLRLSVLRTANEFAVSFWK